METDRINTFDALIVGGGMAGSAAAVAIARTGKRVIILDKGLAASQPIGESLPPAARQALMQLGTWEAFVSLNQPQSPGVVSAWGDDSIKTRDHLFHPYAQGWQIDRAALNRMLVAQAVQRGARVQMGCRIVHWERHTSGGWQVVFHGSDAIAHTCLAATLIDATGRSGMIARGNGSFRRATDSLVAQYAFLSPRMEIPDRRVLVEAAAGGWWYSSGLPNGKFVACYVTLSQLARGQPTKETWAQIMQQSPHTATRTGSMRLLSEIRQVAANSYWMNPPLGTDWMAIGDAATALDPLSSSGILWALETAIRSAELVGRAPLSPDEKESAIEESATRFLKYLQQQWDFYNLEQRWPDSSFWKYWHHQRPWQNVSDGIASDT